MNKAQFIKGQYARLTNDKVKILRSYINKKTGEILHDIKYEDPKLNMRFGVQINIKDKWLSPAIPAIENK